MAMKTCSVCREQKPLIEFSKSKVNPTPKLQRSYCDTCRQYKRHHIEPMEQRCGGCGEFLQYYRFDLVKNVDGTYRLSKVCRSCSADYRECASCHEVKHQSMFSSKGKDRSHVDTVCLVCRAASTVGLREKTCVVCDHTLPITSFRRNEDYCKTCRKTHKKCAGCRVIKSVTEFPITGRSKGAVIYDAFCKVCFAARAKERYHKDLQRSRAERRVTSRKRYWETQSSIG
jgi:hypothetical protein